MKQLLMTISGCERTIGLKRTSIYSLIKKGRLMKVKIGRRTLITTESVEELVDQCKSEAE